MITSRFSVAAFGLPGRFTTKHRPRIPATARESIPCGVTRILAWRIASTRPGAARSITACVASGVISRGLKPVPPVVKIRSISPLPVQLTNVFLIRAISSGTVCRLTTFQPLVAINPSKAGPEASGRVPAEDRSETVRIATLKTRF